MLSLRIPKAAAKIEKRFAVLPEGDRRPQVAEFLEVFFEQSPQALLKFIGIQLH
jgi:hypothetical protein